MKRKLFFFIERLQVSRQEIRAVSICLLILLTGFQLLPAIQNARRGPSMDYSEQDRIFLERTETARQRHREWVDRMAMADSLNRAIQTIPDGEESEVPGDESTHEAHGADQVNGAPGLRLDLNEATEREFQQLPGIGPAYAKRMVQWRERFGPYLSVDQLIEIRGIGPKRLEALRSRVRVTQVGPDSL